MTRVQTRSLILVAVAAFLLAGCGTLNVGVTSPYSMSPKERLATAQRLWVSQEADVKAAADRAKAGTLTDAEAKYYLAKGKRLEELAFVIDSYELFLTGAPPAGANYQTIETRIITFISEFQGGLYGK